MTNANEAASAQAAESKKRRRGVSNETQAVSQLKFHEKDAATNGLFVGHLHSATLEWSSKEDSKIFTGMKFPRLVLHFASQHTSVTEMRHVYQTILPVESNVDTMYGGKEEWRVNNTLAWIKHVLDILYLKGRQFTPEEENALELAVYDSDDEGNYIALDPQDVINAYAAMFTAAVNMLNGQFGLKEGEMAKPCYKDANGNFVKLWMKLLRHKKVKSNWVNITNNGDLGFDGFIGNGVIEIAKEGKAPLVLRVDLAKESITPKEIKKNPTIGGPTDIANMGGVNMPQMPDFANDAFNNAGGDLPY